MSQAATTIKFEHDGKSHVAKLTKGGEVWDITLYGGLYSVAQGVLVSKQLFVQPLPEGESYGIDLNWVEKDKAWVQVEKARDLQQLSQALKRVAYDSCCKLVSLEREGDTVIAHVAAPAFDPCHRNCFALRFGGAGADEWNVRALQLHMNSAATRFKHCFEHRGVVVAVPGVSSVQCMLVYPAKRGVYEADFSSVFPGHKKHALLSYAVDEVRMELPILSTSAPSQAAEEAPREADQMGSTLHT